ncbi:MAG: nitroreductase/quinone reductase family protein [Acidimicrobiales bacterium]
MTTPRSRRDRAIRFVERRITNPIVRTLLRLGLAPGPFALLETTGRRTGKTRWTPIGNGLDGDTFWLVAEQGHQGDYVKNLAADPRVRVKVRRRWRSGSAHFLPADDGLDRRRRIDRRNGLGGRADGIIFRATAKQVVTIRIDLEPD